MSVIDSAGVLRRKDLRWFFAGTTVNRLGGMMTPVTMAFAVLHVDNSAEALSKVLAAEITATVLAVFFVPVFFVVVMRLFRRKAVAEGEAAEARTRHEPARVAAE